MVTAVLEILLATFFGVLGYLIPVVSFGFLLTAGILGLTGVILFVVAQRVAASAAEADRITRTGIGGEATVASVPLRAAPRLRVGQTLPVLVSPDDPNMLMFDWGNVPTIA